MKQIISLLSLLLTFHAGICGQSVRSYLPLENLKSDFQSTPLVALVHITATKIEEDLGGDIVYLSTCEVIEPLKGKLRRGQRLEFVTQAEKSRDMKLNEGELVVFLERAYDQDKKQLRLAALENSTLKYSPTLMLEMRKIKSAHMRRATIKRSRTK